MFLSYARSSEEQASSVERALSDAGYSVWRDTDLPAHLSYAEVIEERLKSAKAVLVLWSAEAAKSQWVRAEADAARELGTLVQSSVDGTIPPIPFNQIQCADLSGWSGDNDHSGWRKLKSSIVALAGQVDEPVKSSKRQRHMSSVCVLPFQNMSGDAVPDYFSDGITEDITSDLSKVSALSVVPRKVAFQFKGQEVDACAVAEKLRVSYVLEGTVRRAGDRVRITAQLIDGSTGDHAWSERYHREFSDIFSVQDEITKAIVDALQVKLLPSEKKAIGESDTSNDALSAKGQEPVQEPKWDETHSAFHFNVQNGRGSGQDLDVQEPQVSAADKSLVEEASASEASPVDHWNTGDQWNAGQEWIDDEEFDENPSSRWNWKKRDYLAPDLAPRLIAVGLVLSMIVAFLGFTFWPERAAPVAPEQELTYTITEDVNVRSLPTRKGSRILGELNAGETINIVPSLAGAQPDWLKIKNGPYVGGYVWRESTRPVLNSASNGGTMHKDTTS